MSRAVFCIADTEPQAMAIITRLKDAGFSNEISVLLPDKGGSRDFAHEPTTKAPEGIAAGGGAGGVLGGALGWLVGIGSLAIPGAGPFIAAGPMMAALSGAAIGAAVGGLAGALVGMGIPQYEAKLYEGKVLKGNVLISVHTKDGDQAKHVKDIFIFERAKSISSSSEATVKSH